MEKHKKLTLEALLAKKAQREKDKTEFKTVYVPGLGGELTLKKLPLERYFALAQDTESDDLLSQYETNKQLIYASCPLLHDKELQEAYDCVDPSDIVGKVFDDNISDMTAVVSAIGGFYGLSDDDLKN